jgi:hypothetical protein
VQDYPTLVVATPLVRLIATNTWGYVSYKSIHNAGEAPVGVLGNVHDVRHEGVM